ncbi:hypothetical protein V493_01259 [Pseudogymnoascus sp. VKM F-4281 (FW-2241)]|nr:hypothetical protein V493_01259 [Pseudogymnoascus sp. VKM F-4281 (FW-2241)]
MEASGLLVRKILNWIVGSSLALARSPSILVCHSQDPLVPASKEALRMYPIVGTPFDRVVPKGGAILSGHFVPEGTVVGISGWVTQRSQGVFGDDAEPFRPERWLDADEKQVRVMDRSMLAFGQGTRGCVGKHVAILALTKTVGQIVRVFDMEWAAPREEWEVTRRQHVRQTGVIMRLKRREVLQ